jgi:protein SCO1/2
MLVMAFWLVLFGIMTHRFSNITLESQRRDDLFTQQPDLSFLRTIDDKGEVSNIAELAITTNKMLITEFIYTQCRAICLSLGNTFQQAQTQIIEKNLSKQLGLVSISFDVSHENIDTLKTYRQRMHADAQVWSLVKMQDASVLEIAKKQLGLMVIKDMQKDFVHNSAFIVVSSTGHVLGIFDPDEISDAIALALKYIALKQKSVLLLND